MSNIQTADELRNAIVELKAKQSAEWDILHDQLLITYENIKPVNFIKEAFGQLTRSPGFKGSLAETTMSLAAGYLSKKAITGNSHNPLKVLLGTFFQMGVTNIILKNAGVIKNGVEYFLKDFALKNKNGNSRL